MPTVPSQRTPLLPEEAIAILRAAVLRRGGDEPLTRLVCAQSDFETDTWKAIWNHNLGNLRGSYQGMTTSIPGATEYDDQGKLVVVSAGFRAYPNFNSAADDKIDLLVRNYPAAWSARDLTTYVDGLWKGRIGSYFGVPPKDPHGPGGRKARDHYERGLESRLAKLFADHQAPAKIDTSDLPVLRVNSAGVHVSIWQKLLGVPRTGKMDQATQAATMNFQSTEGLLADSVVGPATWSRMLS